MTASAGDLKVVLLLCEGARQVVGLEAIDYFLIFYQDHLVQAGMAASIESVYILIAVLLSRRSRRMKMKVRLFVGSRPPMSVWPIQVEGWL